MIRTSVKRISWLLVVFIGLSLTALTLSTLIPNKSAVAESRGPVLVIEIKGSINVATEDYLKTSVAKAVEQRASLLVVLLDTPGGLLTSMQGMVEVLLSADVPTLVYVSPSGGGAMSAGVFITLAAHVAAMAPVTTIGAAHPVAASGQDISGDMRAKVENSAVSLIKGIAEQRGRNAEWAELAVRESVAITAKEALDEKVIDYVASDLDRLLADLEGKTVDVNGRTVTLSNVRKAPRKRVRMSLKQTVVNLLADPNIAVLLSLGAMVGIGLELITPGVGIPGIFGGVCLVLSLTAFQLVPITYGGIGLILLGCIFFVVEIFLPSFGIWGSAGILCFVLGAIYLVDTEQVWGAGAIEVDPSLVVLTSLAGGGILFAAGYFLLSTRKTKEVLGTQGLIGQFGKITQDFVVAAQGGPPRGKVMVMGELWSAEFVPEAEVESPEEVIAKLKTGARVRVRDVAKGLTVVVDLNLE